MINPELGGVIDWMDSQALGRGEIENVSEITGGTQNIMLRFARGEAEYVLRRGPKHLRSNTNEVLRREVRILEAIRDTSVPCPTLLAACDDLDVYDGAFFYLMEPVQGFNATVELPPIYRDNSDARHAMGLAAVDAIARLHALDHHALGLGDAGKPEGFLDRQVPRWLGELESHKRNAGYGENELPWVREVASWLEANVPPTWRPGIAHGDFHLANMMFSRDRPVVAAIVDWEMWTIGDPLLDLAWLLITWPGEAGFAEMGGVAKVGGLASPDALLAHYATQTDRTLSHLDWYKVLACFKLGIIIEGTYARACAGKAEKATGDYLHRSAIDLLTRAYRMTSASKI